MQPDVKLYRPQYDGCQCSDTLDLLTSPSLPWNPTPNSCLQARDCVKPKILVIDDERVIADTLVIILNRNGFEATAAYSGEAAVGLAQTLQPEMVISDVIMNDMNGIDAAIQIRSMLPQCKILLFSGQAATADLLEKARNQGHEFEILAKPVHPQDLLMRLRL